MLIILAGTTRASIGSNDTILLHLTTMIYQSRSTAIVLSPSALLATCFLWRILSFGGALKPPEKRWKVGMESASALLLETGYHGGF